MSLISLNVRGLGGDIKWKYMQELVWKEKPGIVCLQETKRVNLPSGKCYSLWGSNEIGWLHRGIDKEGGGILTMWNNHLFSCSSMVEGKGFICTIGEYKYEGYDQIVRTLLVKLMTNTICGMKLQVYS